jgi:hypothetical protein
VQNVHGFYDKGAIGGVLAGHVRELLGRAQRVDLQNLLPGPELWRGPVPINPASDRDPVLRGFLEDLTNQRRSGIVAINEQRQRSLGILEWVSDT